MATACALSSPAASSHTSRADRIAGRVSVTRVGGGFGAPWTPTTVRSVSRTAGSSGKSDATCVSGPPQHQDVEGGHRAVVLGASGPGQLRGVGLRRGLHPGTVRAVRRGHGVHALRVQGYGVSSASHAWV